MSRPIARRQLLRAGALAGASVWLCGRSVGADNRSPSDKVNLAIIGCGGQGGANLKCLADQNIVALCDVDDQRAGNCYERFPKAKKFYDYRRMLDRMDRQIDAVVVSTPDHSHYGPAMMAMRHGKHLYCEKPLGHTVAEARAMTELAAKMKVATQLGVQRHAYPSMHRIVELIRAGALGPVRECHAWVSSDRGMPPMPTNFPPVPAHLKYDLWLGPAAERPYTPAYVPYTWRFWWDFGSGDIGNWGCHLLDIPYWALGLRYPTRVAVSGPPVDKDRTPKSMQVRYEFPARGDQPPVTLHWSQTKGVPRIVTEHKMKHRGSGVLFIGAKGMLLCDFGRHKLYPEKQFADFVPPAPTIPDSPGFHKEWLIACKGGPAATCDLVNYAGPLAETVSLANVVYRVGHEFAWDGEKLTSPDSPDVAPLLTKTYRKGWEV